MREQDSFPRPVSDPEIDGIPNYADDDSTAYDDVDSPRVADGLDPAPVPLDRDDGPVALDEFGTSAEEQRLGESLDGRLAREEPDLSPDDITESPDPLGRLVDPGLGGPEEDTEENSIGFDAGAAGGGPSAEETAVRETEPD